MVIANPLPVKAIAYAHIETDKIDAGTFFANVDAVLFERRDHPADGMAIDAVGVALSVLHRIRMQASGEGAVRHQIPFC